MSGTLQPPLKYILQLGWNTATVQQATRGDRKNINLGNYMDTWGKENEITRARTWSRYKDATVGKCFMINNGLRVILFSTSNLKMQGKMREEIYNLKGQQLLEKKWEESSLHWVIVTIRIYCVIQKFKDYKLQADILFSICMFFTTNKRYQPFQSQVSPLTCAGISIGSKSI